MENRVEIEEDRSRAERPATTLRLRMLGAIELSRDGLALPLPASRKVRALIAYLALAERPVTRSRLCELLWDVPNDPRGELRWCLSKVRNVLDEPGRPRLRARGETVELDLTGCFVDAVEVARVTQAGVEQFTTEVLRSRCKLFLGDFLDGLAVESNLELNGWLLAQRRRFRTSHIALLEHLSTCVPAEEAFEYLERWLALAPFDRNVHDAFLTNLARTGRLRDGEAHTATTVELFEAQGLDGSAIRHAWQAAKASHDSFTTPQAPASAFMLRSLDRAHDVVTVGSRRASVAIMPFADRSCEANAPGDAMGGLARDIITRLAKLRSLFVIAQGSVFALHERGIGPEEAGRTLNVDYVVNGSLVRRPKRLRITVELAETRTARIVWTEEFDYELEDAFVALDAIGDRIVASIASEIEASERNRAILKPPTSLDAWEAHHRGLWHMYRFNRADNARAQHFFKLAVRLDPTFARAYAGLSFTHFQNAFQGWTERAYESDRAFEAAGQSLLTDDHDPAAHWAMGRALWLRGRQDQALGELERAVDLSPNFALAHYTLAFVHSQSGDPRAAIRSADQSRDLSPFDPLLFGMLASRAMALVRLGQYDEAADWAVKAAARPNAHAHIRAIAAYCLALAERRDEARTIVTAIRQTDSQYDVDDFLAAFRFGEDGTALFRRGAQLSV